MKGGKKGVQREAWKGEGAGKAKQRPGRGKEEWKSDGRRDRNRREQGAHVTWEVAVTLVRCN
jgi:hypothetical protein